MNTENEPVPPRTRTETEALALQIVQRRTDELLKSKENELAAKEEIITLLREKIAQLEQVSEAVYPPVSGTPRKRQTGQAQNNNPEPKSSWDRLKDWFFNA